MTHGPPPTTCSCYTLASHTQNPKPLIRCVLNPPQKTYRHRIYPIQTARTTFFRCFSASVSCAGFVWRRVSPRSAGPPQPLKSDAPDKYVKHFGNTGHHTMASWPISRPPMQCVVKPDKRNQCRRGCRPHTTTAQFGNTTLLDVTLVVEPRCSVHTRATNSDASA